MTTPRFKTNYPTVTWRKARQAVVDRDIACQMVYEPGVPCRHHSGDLVVHHKRLRSQGGTNALDNLVLLCSLHHGHVHANPAWSYRHGWLVR